MTPFLKDFNYVKSRIEKAKNTTEIVGCKILMEMFLDKYVVQVSHMNPIYIAHKTILEELYQEKFRKMSSCI